MAYQEKEARELVVRAGHRLLEAGLTARTWGNISARISDQAFVITPSGRGYEDMKPEDLVVVQIQDCSYEGTEKPSSEKGIHADAYRLRPGVDFVIHTHQDHASAVGVTGEAITGLSDSVLGGCVPCAAYGLPSTNTLRLAVAGALEEHPEAQAVLMKNHGALCLGSDMETAFAVAKRLERICKEQAEKTLGAEAWSETGEINDYGKSQRSGERFRFSKDGETKIYSLKKLPEGICEEAAIHAAIYRATGLSYLVSLQSPLAERIVRSGKALKPYLDDLAQIAGTEVDCVVAGMKQTPALAARAMKGKNALLFSDGGAICGGMTADDALAVRTILEKGCEAALYGRKHGAVPLSYPDCLLQRVIYQKKYSRQKERGHAEKADR